MLYEIESSTPDRHKKQSSAHKQHINQVINNNINIIDLTIQLVVNYLSVIVIDMTTGWSFNCRSFQPGHTAWSLPGERFFHETVMGQHFGTGELMFIF